MVNGDEDVMNYGPYNSSIPATVVVLNPVGVIMHYALVPAYLSASVEERFCNLPKHLGNT